MNPLNNLAILGVVARPKGVYVPFRVSRLVCLPSAEPPRKAAADRPFVANHFGPRSWQGPRADHQPVEEA